MPTQAPRRIGSPLLVILSILLGALLIAFGLYAGIAKRYEQMFLPGSTINGLDVSGMTISQAERALEDTQEDYTLTFVERDSVTETITGQEIDLSMVFDDALAQNLEDQNQWVWPLAVMGRRVFPMEAKISFCYDTAKLTEAISRLKCMNSAASTPPKDAYLSGYNAEIGGVEIIPEVQGNLVDQSILLPAIQNAIATMQNEINLESLGCYVAPTITADDPGLQAQAKQLNEYLGVKITYQMGPDTVEIDGQRLIDWLSFDDEGNASLKSEKVTAFVRQLAHDYNTIYAKRTFHTSYGQEITVEGGDYGWWMNEPEEVEALTAQILNKESGVREPVWRQKAAALGAGGSGDIGGTYVEVNLTAQHLFFYKDGQLMLESDCVTGKNDGTPTGTYSFTYKERYATLKGENYSSPVSYWMPFSGNVGLHDATWRTNFGGTLYKSGGSHGCVNLPIKTAKFIYENIDAESAAVIVYKLDGTERSDTSSQSYEDIASSIVAALDEIESSGKITSGNYNVMKKRIEWAQAAYSHLSGAAQDKVTNYSKLSDAVAALRKYQNG
jgi:hypothetical protein